MAQGQVHFPPQGPGSGKVVDFVTCLQWGEELTLYFDVLGIFSYTSMGNFTPGLPMGLFQPGSITGPYTAVSHNATVILNYYDPESGVLYVDTVTIQKNPCPKTRRKKAPNSKKS